METAIWFWKRRVHSVPDVLRGHFGATTKAIVNQECVDQSKTDVAKKRYLRFIDCLKVCNYTDNDYSEEGCYSLPGADHLALILICISVIICITLIGAIALSYHFGPNLRKNQNQSVPNQQLYDSVGQEQRYEPINKVEEHRQLYDDTITNGSNQYEVMQIS